MCAVVLQVRFNTGTLKEVAVAGCRAGEDAAVALVRAANKNTTLQLLDIRGVPLAAEVRQPGGKGARSVRLSWP